MQRSFMVATGQCESLTEWSVAGAALMHDRMLKELASRLPARVERRELDVVARIAAIALDGLMMAVVAAHSPAERNLSRRAWTPLVDLLITELNP
jgi:hypothetical protein